MTSFGENELQVGSRLVGRVRVLGILPGTAVFPRIVIRLGVTLHDSPKNEFAPGRPVEAFEVRDLQGELRLAEGGMAVASLHWIGHRRHVRSSSYGSENEVSLTCDLDPFRLERLEEHRAGGEIAFWLALWPTLVDAIGFLDSEIRPLRFVIPRETWLEVLGALTDSHVTLLEVRRPHLEAPEFKAAMGHVRDARNRVDHGDFDESVACCRRAIEAMAQALDVPHAASGLEEALAKVTDTKRAKAYAGIVSKLKELGNYTIHRHEATGKYTRAEAQFAIGSTEHALALIAMLLQRPK
jgi:hypothetical protein